MSPPRSPVNGRHRRRRNGHRLQPRRHGLDHRRHRARLDHDPRRRLLLLWPPPPQERAVADMDEHGRPRRRFLPVVLLGVSVCVFASCFLVGIRAFAFSRFFHLFSIFFDFRSVIASINLSPPSTHEPLHFQPPHPSVSQPRHHPMGHASHTRQHRTAPRVTIPPSQYLSIPRSCPTVTAHLILVFPSFPSPSFPPLHPIMTPPHLPSPDSTRTPRPIGTTSSRHQGTASFFPGCGIGIWIGFRGFPALWLNFFGLGFFRSWILSVLGPWSWPLCAKFFFSFCKFARLAFFDMPIPYRHTAHPIPSLWLT